MKMLSPICKINGSEPSVIVCLAGFQFDEILNSLDRSRKLVLFGTGRIGKNILRLLQDRDVKVDFWADNDPERVGTTIEGIPVLSFSETLEMIDRIDLMITSTAFIDILKKFQKHGGNEAFKSLKGVFNGRFPKELMDIGNVEPYIDATGKVWMERLNYVLTKSCNLKCKYCSSMSTHRTGITPLAVLKESSRIWQEKINADSLIFAGGEPFVHPDIEEILLDFRSVWPDAKFELFTNGLLLPKLKKSLFQAIKDTNTKLFLSIHENSEAYWSTIANGTGILNEYEIPYMTLPSYSGWTKVYQFSEDMRIIPIPGERNKSYEICFAKDCPVIRDYSFHRCGLIRGINEVIQEKVVGPEWKAFEEETILGPDCTPQEMFQMLKTGPYKACQLCPDKYEYLFDVEQMK